MDLRGTAAFLLALATLFVASRASAWEEAHEAGDDAHIRVESDGTATIDHTVRWRVVRGPLKAIELKNVAPAAVIDAAVTITAEDGRVLAGHAARAEDGTVRVLVDDPKSVGRGTFAFAVRWSVDLRASGALTREGATYRLVVAEPTALEGLDVTRTVVDLPAAPDAPQPIAPDTGLVDDGVLATLHRDPDRGVLELVRPHVSRGESVTWTLRLDERALAGRPSAPSAGAPSSVDPDRAGAVAAALVLVSIGAAFAFLVRAKGRAFAARFDAASGRAVGLVPLSPATRAVLGGACLSAAVAVEVERPGLGGVLVALATLLATCRVKPAGPGIRGPGRWLPLRPGDAFAPSAADRSLLDWLDVTRPRGWVTAAALAVLLGAVAFASRRLAAEGPWLTAMDAAALVPLFATGCASQASRGGPREAAPWLSRAYARLRVFEGLRVVPWARVLRDGGLDEVRLLVLPRQPLPGVVGIELGLAWSRTAVGPVGSPELLVRVADASVASVALAAWRSEGRTLPGRRRDERVLRLLPRAPTRRAAVALTRSLARALTERRRTAPPAPWAGRERRVTPPPCRVPEVASAAGAGLC